MPAVQMLNGRRLLSQLIGEFDGSVAYWLKPMPYKRVNRVQFSAEPFASLAIW
jgi:hypothetical protein